MVTCVCVKIESFNFWRPNWKLYQIWMEVEWCVAKKLCILHWENDRGALAGREIARAKEWQNRQLSLSHFLPLLSQSHAAVGGHPHPPWEHRGVNPGVSFKSHPTHLRNMEMLISRRKNTHLKVFLHSHFLREGFTSSFKIRALPMGPMHYGLSS